MTRVIKFLGPEQLEEYLNSTSEETIRAELESGVFTDARMTPCALTLVGAAVAAGARLLLHAHGAKHGFDDVVGVVQFGQQIGSVGVGWCARYAGAGRGGAWHDVPPICS